MLPPKHMDKLLINGDCCTCDLEWRCVPYDTCFVYDSCLCKGSSSFLSVKPLHPSWAEFSYDWYYKLASCLKLHPHSPLPRFGLEVEYLPLVMLYYCVPPPADWLLLSRYLPSLLFVPIIVSHCYCLMASCLITIIVLCSLKCRLLFLLS